MNQEQKEMWKEIKGSIDSGKTAKQAEIEWMKNQGAVKVYGKEDFAIKDIQKYHECQDKLTEMNKCLRRVDYAILQSIKGN